ncbi:hypothetical protein [Nocardioides sp.]|uniref:hypothetical protein n=1 Tax=Nocardioides sp. TaxID=35761 RepID=UPI0039E540FA
MAKYRLQPDEVVILTADHVQRGDSRLPVYTDELILTNLHLIWVGKGILGNAKGIAYFPLSSIKVFEDTAQARLGQAPNRVPQLEVYFQSDEETFRFQAGSKREIGEWVSAINRVVTGNDVSPGRSTRGALPGTEAVAESLRDTFNQFKAAFGGGRSAPPPSGSTKVSTKCSSCGAPISGVRGTTVVCQYCDSTALLS